MAGQEIAWLLRDKYGGEKSQAFFADAKRLALGEPLAYLIGWTPFHDCKISLDKKPLIPRPETEYWVDEAIKTISGGATISLGIETKHPKILDLCAGSGCIGVAVAKAIPEAGVDFGEIDADLLPTIEKNIKENLPQAKKYRVVQTNLFSNISDKYDFILVNPPYIDESLNRTEQSVKENEPYLALFAGEQGLELIAEIINSAPAHLASGGQLWIEHEPEQSEAIKELATINNFEASAQTDQFGLERYSILVLK